YAALAALFFIPAVFFLFSHAVLWGVPLSRIGATMASGYAFLPFVMVAGLSIFPLTVLELAVLALPLLAVAGIPVAERHAFMMPAFNAMAVLWLLVLVAAVGSLSAVSQLQLLRTLFATSVIDPLTGVFNRGSGAELIALQFALARRHGYPLALAFVDLDDFKQINDTAGHDSGDRLLEQTAQAWRTALRKSDAILRWGGEEFILLLPYADCAQAEHLVRSRLPALQRPDGKPLTYSIGIAEWSADGLTHWQPLVALADQRMYQAKAAGKARIVTCTPG
ncbi:MAG: GGDEF domain-containing protein, partial [Gammaproteobacteria bacterium]|nr:GGDEF domain-containing protein [Gammaproteobacteria bacterium]